MKIVQFMATSGGIGGLEQHTFQLVNQLAERHEVYMIAHPCYSNNFTSKVHFYGINLSRSRWNPFLLWELRQLIDKIQPDILHAQAGKASELIAKIKHKLPAVKIVSTIHGTKKNKKPYFVGDAIIAVSSALAEGLPSKSVYVIYNGVNQIHKLSQAQKIAFLSDVTKEFPQHQLDLQTLICIGRLEPVKNIALLLQAIQGLNVNLWIVGDGTQRCALEQQCKKMGLEKNVLFWGFRNHASELIQLADLVVLSSDREGFPLVMVEALQAHKPMVSTRVNGVKEWLPERYLVPVGDAKMLKHIIVNALQYYDLNNDFEPLYRRAEQELTVTAMVDKTEIVYRKLLADSSNST